MKISSIFLLGVILAVPRVWANDSSSSLPSSLAITLSEVSHAAGLVSGSQERLLKQGIDIKQLTLGIEAAYQTEPSVKRLTLATENSVLLAIPATKTQQTVKRLARPSFDFGTVLAMRIKQPFKMLDIPAFITGFKKSYEQGISSPESAAASLRVSHYVQQQRMLGAAERLIKAQTFLAENAQRNGVVTTKSGLQYEILAQSSGAKPTVLDMVTVSYRNAKRSSDFSYDFTQDIQVETYPLRGAIPEGWQELFLLMGKGARYRAFVSPALGFGVEGVGEQVLPNEVLITEFTLLDIIPPPTVNY